MIVWFKKAKLTFERVCFLVLITLLFTGISANALDRVNLLYSPKMKSPVFKKPKVIYEMDFVFNKCPQEYVLYYDRNEKKLVIDFYGASVSLLDTTNSSSFSGELKVKNVETAMSLTGLKGRILFTPQKEWSFDQGWHYESSVFSPTTLRVKLWIEIRPILEIKSKKGNKQN